MTDMKPVTIPGGTVMVADRGSGDPVLLVQTALTADELVPLAENLERGGHRVVLYHRRGYGASSPAGGAVTVVGDAEDCHELLSRIGLASTHVVSTSYGAAVALELAARWPSRVRSLTLIEPPPVVAPSVVEEFAAANSTLLTSYRERGAPVALEEFLTLLMGVRWRATLEQWLPGSVEQVTADAETFFGHDVPALIDWRFDDRDAARITCPVLYVGGSASGEWFAAVRQQVLSWFPDAEDVVVPDADHNLALTHVDQIALAVGRFIARQRSGRQP